MCVYTCVCLYCTELLIPLSIRCQADSVLTAVGGQCSIDEAEACAFIHVYARIVQSSSGEWLFLSLLAFAAGFSLVKCCECAVENYSS